MFGIKEIFRNRTYSPLPKKLVEEYNQHRPSGPKKHVCYSPFQSLYFGHHGQVVTCCYNRTQVLGVYPKQSIQEIWNGAEAEKLRDHIRHNDLSLGCHSCEKHMLSKNFDGIKSTECDDFPINRNGYPSSMSFELSNVCNLECEMCSGDFSSLIRAKREKLPPLEMSYDAAFVDQLEEFIPHLTEVKFYGGEPFLINMYYDIWERIMKINPAVRISVQTNATVLNNRVKELLEHTNFHISVSLDSLIKDVYEGIRRNADFDRVMENIKYFHAYRKAKNSYFGVSVCAMQQNWKELPEFIKFCNNLDVPVYFHTVVYPLHCSLRAMKSDELQIIFDHLSSFDFPEANPVQKKNKKHYTDFVNQVKTWLEMTQRVVSKERPQSIAAMKEVIAEYIMISKDLSIEAKQKKIEKVKAKLAELESRIDGDFIEKAAAKFDTTDPAFLDNAVFFLDRMPIPVLVTMIKSAFS